jgi:uncharacterized protein YndB with AHSA1/START domain
MDVKAGGAWKHVMHGPDGKDYPNKIVYAEVVKRERIVYDHESHPPFQATVTFEEQGAKTQVSMRMVFATSELRDKTDKAFGAVEGLKQTLGRLVEEVAKSPVIVERTYDAPAEKVWKAITEFEQLKQWFMKDLKSFKPELGFQTEFTVYHNGKEYAHLWRVDDVVPGKRIAVEWKFYGFSGVSLASMELFPEKARTRLRVTHEGIDSHPQDNPDFSRGSFLGGWNKLINEGLNDHLQMA